MNYSTDDRILLKRTRRSLIPVIIIMSLIFVQFCSADTFIVDSQQDSHDPYTGDGICGDGTPGSCSFRAAIEESNTLLGNDTILFTSSQKNWVTLGRIIITDNGTILIGAGGATVIDGVGNQPAASTLVLASDSNEISGITFSRSRGGALRIEGAYNIIGGSSIADRNHFIENGLDDTTAAAICITSASARYNSVLNNFIGMDSIGLNARGNRHGLRIERGAAFNRIEGAFMLTGNLLSGNEGYGLIFALGAHDNMLTGATIGPNISGEFGPGNGAGGILINSGAHNNRIGGDKTATRNIISANGGDGIHITDPGSDRNSIIGNYIGPELVGRLPLPNARSGVRITNSASQTIIGTVGDGGNLISGNRGDGITLIGSGTSETVVRNNFIGSDRRGIGRLSNGTDSGHGIALIDGPTNTLIGGQTFAEGNLISGNINHAILISGSASTANRITANFIGLNISGLSSLGNGSGIVIMGGAHHNVIGSANESERNIISGNRGSVFPFVGGVVILGAGTSNNVVSGNLIGTDIGGVRALRNGSAGVIIGSGATNNIIGGTSTGERNVISGNGSGNRSPFIAAGIHLFGTGTSYNRIENNLVGIAASGAGPLANRGHGLGLVDGASSNWVGGNEDQTGNTIAYNMGHGVFLSGKATSGNVVRYNAFFENDSSGIAIRNDAQQGVLPPQSVNASLFVVEGSAVPPGSTVDIFRASPDKSGSGEGRELIGTATSDASGTFAVYVIDLLPGDTLTTQLTDPEGNSSEFSVNIVVDAITDISDDDSILPTSFVLEQNFPNPFNPATTIRYTLPYRSNVRLEVFNLLGELVILLEDGMQPAGERSVIWTGFDQQKKPAASGLYFYRLSTDGSTSSRKMILLK